MPAPEPVVCGLSAAEAQLPVSDFFAQFPFEPPPPGQDTLSAAEFLSFL
ncbi:MULTISPECIES: hypothetical protein [Myxococcaceae]|nr:MULTISPECIES: hypothetical protein [Myxococcaceae]MBF5041670.1 hypothetical protein [Simulacricoccus sp. 17bor-14]